MKIANPLVARARVAERVANKFLGKPFAWGERDCVRMAHLVLVGLGHASPLRSAGSYRTERGALKAMKRLGYAGVDQALDDLGFVRIAPAEALPCDLLGFESRIPNFGVALGVAVSGGKCVAFIDDEAIGGNFAVLGFAHLAKIAWRVL